MLLCPAFDRSHKASRYNRRMSSNAVDFCRPTKPPAIQPVRGQFAVSGAVPVTVRRVGRWKTTGLGTLSSHPRPIISSPAGRPRIRACVCVRRRQPPATTRGSDAAPARSRPGPVPGPSGRATRSRPSERPDRTTKPWPASSVAVEPRLLIQPRNNCTVPLPVVAGEATLTPPRRNPRKITPPRREPCPYRAYLYRQKVRDSIKIQISHIKHKNKEKDSDNTTQWKMKTNSIESCVENNNYKQSNYNELAISWQ